MSELHTIFNQTTSIMLNYCLLLAGVGAIAMALVEALKGMIAFKARFQRFMINQWLKTYHSSLTLEDITGESGRHPFIIYTASGAMCALEPSQTVAKLQQLLERTLSSGIKTNPKQGLFISFYSNLLGQANVDNYLAAHDSKDKKNVAEIEREIYALLLGSLDAEIDLLQIRIEYYWGKINRFLAIIFGAILLYFILSESGELSGLSLYISSIFGGALSPVAKNLAKSIRGAAIK